MQAKPDVKIQLDTQAGATTKRVQTPTNFAALDEQVRQMINKAGLSTDVKYAISYRDLDNDPISIEEDSDLEMAYSSEPDRIKFFVKLLEQAPVQMIVDEEMKEEIIDTTDKKHQPRKGKNTAAKKEAGIPRKALKNLIQSEFDKQSQEIFVKLLRAKNLDSVKDGQTESVAEGTEHHNVECDGCGVHPIQGLRFKCSVCKNFDFCETCEARLEHEHAFLKIRDPTENPDVMITMLNDDMADGVPVEQQPQPAEAQEQQQHPWASAQKNWGGRGGRGRGGCNKPWKQWQKIAENFLSQNGVSQEDVLGKVVQEVFSRATECQKEGGEQGCKGGWNLKRAVIVSKPEGVLEGIPGQTLMVELTVMNETHWPWKKDCILSLDSEQSMEDLPVEIFQVPVEQEVRGKQELKITVPLTVRETALASDNVHEIRLAFHGPQGTRFGQVITLKLKVNAGIQLDNTEFYRTVIKLHQQLKLGSFEECRQAFKQNNCDEAATIKDLQQRK